MQNTQVTGAAREHHLPRPGARHPLQCPKGLTPLENNHPQLTDYPEEDLAIASGATCDFTNRFQRRREPPTGRNSDLSAHHSHQPAAHKPRHQKQWLA